MKTTITSLFLFLLFAAANELSGQVSGSLQTSESNIQFADYDEYVQIELQYDLSSKNHVTTQHKYGEPEIDEINWKNTLFRDDPEDWGTAVSIGHLDYLTKWEIEKTTIGISLGGDNYKIILGIGYYSKEFSGLQEEKDEAELEEKL